MKKLEITGDRYGRLTVLGEAPSDGSGRSMWRCRCDCGNECIVSGSNLRSGHSSSCGCKKHIDLSGQKIGRLTVICRSDVYVPRGKRTYRSWKCICECGAVVYKSTDDLNEDELHSCARCRELYAAEIARSKAGFVGGTQLSRIKTMNAPSTNTSGVRGVYYDKKTHKWRARLKFRGKVMNFGYYERFEDAVVARKHAEDRYFKSILDEYTVKSD